MPAQDPLDSSIEASVYFHVYNTGIDGKNLFSDDKDYRIFLSYLQEYLVPRDKSEDAKKTFTIKGQVYRGLPHQPKNYFNKVELIAYSLLPDHFHLVAQQLKKGSLENLVRSLSTRYAIYFNKKYTRKGNLFAGRYKSLEIKELPSLLLLTRHIHRESLYQAGYSSYPEYIQQRSTYWIKTNPITSYLGNSDKQSFVGVTDYKNFVERYDINSGEEKIVESIIIEKLKNNSPNEIPIIEETKPVQTVEVKMEKKPRHYAYIFGSIVLFLLLNSIAIRNINLSQPQSENTIAILPSPTPTATSQVAGLEASETESEILVIINIADGSKNVNLRKSATIDSPIVGQANEGDVFEYLSESPGWYEIRLDNATTAFVSTTSAVLERKNN